MPEAAGGAPGARPGEILVVDDHEANRVLLQELLEQEGHRVVLAGDGAAALCSIAGRQPDLVLLDVNMPGLDGFEVCRRLRAAPVTASLPIILVTALADREQRLTGIAAGANDYLTKPIDRAELRLRVRNALHLRSLHREVAEQYLQLRRLEQLRDSLVHMLVHDLRSPLTGLMGYLGLARLKAAELGLAELEADLLEAEASTVQMAGMVNNVLDVSRFEADAMPLRCTTIDLRVTTQEAVASLALRSRYATIELAHPDHTVAAYADPEVIRRVIANLVGNAVKFTPRDGTVRVATRLAEASAEVHVSDSGPGIPPEHHQKIFEKFGQVEGQGRPGMPSSGLGLTFCRLAVEAHRGRIGLESQPGRGSTFWFSLPVPS